MLRLSAKFGLDLSRANKNILNDLIKFKENVKRSLNLARTISYFWPTFTALLRGGHTYKKCVDFEMRALVNQRLN